ncbi:hypothetical protein BB8028_0001g14550 [Beauveria bassiana]|uniref:Uncharacterized protein n=1 Tax=Beauveria bassiana TaxID=176275 RepID=A0A2S7XZQ2_BEABA|nr:hypothetical protein BB8028_0001g14550 [Beauveria bassiana]
METMTNSDRPPIPEHCLNNIRNTVARFPMLELPARQHIVAVQRQMPARCEAGNNCEHHIGDDSSLVAITDTIMAVTISDSDTMGCAFFSTQDSCLFIAQDVPLVDASVLQHFLEHVQPSSILIPARFPNNMVDVIGAYVDSSYLEHTTRVSHVSTLANSEFSISTSKDRLIKVFSKIENEPRTIFHLQKVYPITDRPARSNLPDLESTAMHFLRLSARLGSKGSVSVRYARLFLGFNSNW